MAELLGQWLALADSVGPQGKCLPPALAQNEKVLVPSVEEMAGDHPIEKTTAWFT